MRGEGVANAVAWGIYKEPSAQSGALGKPSDAAAEHSMTHPTNNGSAQSSSAKDFNERVKRLLENKVDIVPEKPKQFARRMLRGGPKPAS